MPQNIKAKKYLKITLISLVIYCFLFTFIPAVLAAETKTTAEPNIKLQVPIFDYGTAKNITEYIGKIFSYALMVLVPLAIIMIIYAGIRWITSGGNRAQISQAKKIISSAIMGMVIGLLSYVILDLVGLTSLNPITPEYIDPEEDPVTADGGALSDYPADYANTGTGNSKWDIELGKVYSTQEQCKDRKTGQLKFNNDGTPKMCYKWFCPGIQTTMVSCPKIGTSFKVNVKALQAFQTACNNLPAGLPKLVNGGSFNCRGNVNSPGKPSNHAYGTAFDIDPSRNKNCKNGTGQCISGQGGAGCSGKNKEKHAEIRQQALAGDITQLCTRAREFGCVCNLPPSFIVNMIKAGFTWGGTYPGTYDPMHFEVKR